MLTLVSDESHDVRYVDGKTRAQQGNLLARTVVLVNLMRPVTATELGVGGKARLELLAPADGEGPHSTRSDAQQCSPVGERGRWHFHTSFTTMADLVSSSDVADFICPRHRSPASHPQPQGP